MGSILFIFGTRPESIKIGPVVAELRELGIEPEILCTGQHTDLLKGSPAETDLAGCENLQMSPQPSGTLWTISTCGYLVERLRVLRPAVIVVQGDTKSSLAGAFAAKDAKIPLAHIEAGVRSHSDSPWPEEEIRVEIAQLAKYHYAPTSTTFVNLVAEGVPRKSIWTTGNTCISALARYTKASPVSNPEPRILVTFHRREVQNAGSAKQIAAAVLSSARVRPGLRFCWPMHPGFSKWLIPSDDWDDVDNIDLVSPMPYAEFAETLASSLGVLTDSGGVVEEAATLGVPSVVARPANDRSEAEAASVSTLLPPTYDGILEGINVLACKELKRKPLNIYGTPQAAAGIAGHLARIVR